MYQRYINSIEKLEQEQNLRVLPDILPEGCINLSSNDYLGINNDIKIRDEFMAHGIDKFKFGAASSRLLTGNYNEYHTLEKMIANAYQREACLIYNSGYHANTGILPALSSKNDLIIADKLVHASIIDGMHLSKADIHRFNHSDYKHLEQILQKSRNNYEHVFIVTESIFSMDGDMANLPLLTELKKKYNAWLYVDEAHAFGVRGKQGLGCVEESGCTDKCDFIVGTFGKAIASAGAYVVCNDIIKQYLVNHSRTLIFTTALPPVILAWTKFIFERLPEYGERRNSLKTLGNTLAQALNVKAGSHIVPYIVGSNENAVNISETLRCAGFHVMPIRYPTVPKGKARLRFSLNATMNSSIFQHISQILKNNGYSLD